MTEDELTYAVKNGIIDISLIQSQYEMSRREELLNRHPYEPWQNKAGKWFVYFPTENNGRVRRERNTKKEIEELIVKYQKGLEDNPTVRMLYKEWVNGKVERGEREKATENRYDRQFDECMGKFADRKIRHIEEYDIEEFLMDAIHTHQLTSKGFCNLRTIIYGVFKLAKKKKLIDFSITAVVKDMDISRKLFRKNVKSMDELVYNEEEKKLVEEYICNQSYSLQSLGILLLFKTGLRSGELAALRWEDISHNAVHVSRTEIRYKDETGNHYEVRNFPKTEAGIRCVYIPERYEWIFDEIRKLNPEGVFVFEKDGKRLRTYQFDQKLETICRRLKIKKKSQNKIRKTYATILLDSNVQESLILSQMGHTDLATTKGYYYKDMHSEKTKNNMIDKIQSI